MKPRIYKRNGFWHVRILTIWPANNWDHAARDFAARLNGWLK